MNAIVIFSAFLGSTLAFPENGGILGPIPEGVEVGDRGWDSWAEDLTGLFTGLWGKYISIFQRFTKQKGLTFQP